MDNTLASRPVGCEIDSAILIRLTSPSIHWAAVLVKLDEGRDGRLGWLLYS